MTSSTTATPDGGWGWLVVFAAFVVNFVTDGIQDTFGVLLPYLVEDFKESRSKTAWIGSVLYGAPLLCGPVASIIANRIGYRKATMFGGLIACVGLTSAAFVNSVNGLIITYGVIAGIGLSLLYLSSVIIVSRYFKKKRTLATGIAECGAGMGTFVMAPLLKHLIEIYSWRGAVMVVGGISLNIVACGAVYRRLSLADVPNGQNGLTTSKIENESATSADISIIEFEHNKTEPDKKQLNNVKYAAFMSVLHNKSFLIFTLSTVIYTFWVVIPFVFTVDRAKLLHIGDNRAEFLLSSIGVAHIFGNVLYGFLGDRKQVSRMLLFGMSLLIAGIVICSIPLFTTFVPFIIACALYGLLSASETVLTSVIILDIVGMEQLDCAFGIILFLQGIAVLAGPPVADEGIVDLTPYMLKTNKMSGIDGNWFREDWEKGDLGLSLKIIEILHQESSEHQCIKVLKSQNFGNVLLLDGHVQYTEADEFAYHEMMTRLALNSHPDPKKTVIDVCRKYLQNVAKTFNNSKVKIVINDGSNYIKDHINEFDVIITDVTEPIGPAEDVYKENYYRHMKKALKPNGVICSQGENMLLLDLPLIRKIMDFSRVIFPHVEYAFALVPSYLGGHNGFILCSNNKSTNFKEPLRKMTEGDIRKMKLKYYNEDIHRASFCLPQNVKRELYPSKEERIETEETKKYFYLEQICLTVPFMYLFYYL